MKLPNIQIGFQVFVSDGGQEVGAVRQVARSDFPSSRSTSRTRGDFVVPLTAVASVHDNKVVRDCKKLETKLRRAVGPTHDAEEPGA